MRKPPPALMPIFRSQNQAELLAWLFLRPGVEITLSDLARQLGVTPGAVHAEVERLTTAGLLRTRSVGRSRLLQANTEARAARALTELLTIAFGPEVVVKEEFSGVQGADLIAIFGSWARRYRGELGREPADIDVIVVGSVDRDEVYDAAQRAEQRLGMPVNPTVRSRVSWINATDSLVATAKLDALILIDRRESAG